ncbi:EF hand domain protein [Candidatus Thiomargarita nelsonii]|uniref:EF hand domain protein n=1 Tax=Candidatus Thiomargarita nelsonii TaxID=1003181 RepID=A0A0A6NZJ5_9GAMM|nr:EF hand domain protein [Candidatus Thiomargarita nelsonii]
MKTIVTLSSAIALSLSLGAVADNGNRLAKFDVNQDGSITRDEVQIVLNERFTTADTDGDGFLSLDEMSAAYKQRKQQRAAEHFAEMDSNKDGSLSLAEFQASQSLKFYRGRKHRSTPEQRFSRLDQDGDGLLSDTELARVSLRIFGRWDSNQDDVISAEELSQKPRFRHHRR